MLVVASAVLRLAGLGPVVSAAAAAGGKYLACAPSQCLYVGPKQTVSFGPTGLANIGRKASIRIDYRLVASDGGNFAFRDTAFHASTAATKLNKPIVRRR
jgi:hypothetical protein